MVRIWGTRYLNADFVKNKDSHKTYLLVQTRLPGRQMVAAILCDLKEKAYLIGTDYYSSFLKIAQFECTTSAFVIGNCTCLHAEAYLRN